jgi:long-chain acyl-CoA synthetase
MFPGAHAATTPDKPAVIMADTGDRLTYAQLEERSIRLSRRLHDAGLRKGDHVAFLATNSAEVFEIYWAALRSGLYVTGVNHHLATAEAAYIVNDCGARALIVSGEKAGLAAALASLTPAVELRLAFRGEVVGHEDYEDALAASSSEALAEQPRGADMLYSSGTTGRPKGIKPPLPPREVHEPGDPFAGVFGPMYGFDAKTVYHSSAPTYHAAPLRFGGIVQMFGGTVVLSQRFDPEQTLAIVDEYQVTHAQFVPTMFVRMLKLPAEVRARHAHDSLRVVIHAAAPCPVDVKRAMINWWGPILHEYYASTEANGITLIRPEEWLAKPGSVGKAGLGVIHICDEHGAELPVGTDGTVYFERDVPPFEYHNDPEKSREARHPDHENWTTTGDIGHVDADGYLYLTDRKAFMIIAGGVNIYPQEVEDCLALHPAILDVAVIGLPDEDLGERVAAFVQPAEGMVPDAALAEQILAFARERIAPYKTPRTLEFVADLPRTPTGKLLKGVLKKDVVEGRVVALGAGV